MMRIITGKARGIRLKTLEGDATRPTAERVKEAVFSMLQYDIEGREVLDLFAGSGQLGLESVSRGAKVAVLVDKSRDALKIIEENVARTKLSDCCEIHRADALDFIQRYKSRKFDIVFLDPPYASGLYVPVLKALVHCGLLKTGAVVVCESDTEGLFGDDTALQNLFTVKKQSKYSRTVITVLALAESEAEDEQ